MDEVRLLSVVALVQSLGEMLRFEFLFDDSGSMCLPSQGGTCHSETDWLKMDESTGESWVAQCLSMAGERPSRPGTDLITEVDMSTEYSEHSVVVLWTPS